MENQKQEVQKEERSLSKRIFGAYDHVDSVKVITHEVTPEPGFENQNGFLDETIRLLKDQGRDVYVSEAVSAVGPEAFIKVPAIRERQSGVKGKLNAAAFRVLESFYGAPEDLRKLGAILFKLGDDWSNIEDPQVKSALLEADTKFPFKHTPRMPLGTPLNNPR